MTKEILMILVCVPLYVVNAFCDKHISARTGNCGNIAYNTIKFLICSLCMLPMFLLEDAPRFGIGAIACGAACGVMYAISKTVMLKGYERTSVAFMTLCHASGMILPCVIGHFFWQEALEFFSIVGIVLTVASIVLLKAGKGEKKEFDGKGIAIGGLVFLTSGGVMVVQKLMGIYFAGESVSAFNFYSFFMACGILACFLRSGGREEVSKKVMVLCAAGSAVSLCVISMVMTSMTGKVPSVVMFPLFNGLGIVCVCIGSVFAFREKLTVKKVIGLILGVCGLCLVNL